MIEDDIDIKLGDSISTNIPEEPMPWKEGIIPFGLPKDSPTLIFLRAAALTTIAKHGQSTVEKEVMGIIIGHVYYCPVLKIIYDRIEAAIPSKLARGTSTFVEFDHDAWAEVLAQKERQYSSMQIIGWYHTHPNYGAFFSTADEFCHKLAFPNAWQIGCTYDPINNSGALFGWNSEGKIALLEGFYELLEPNYTFSRIANLGINWDFNRITVKRLERSGKAFPNYKNVNSYAKHHNITPTMSQPERIIMKPKIQKSGKRLNRNLDNTAEDWQQPTNCIKWRWTLIFVLILLLTAIGILLFNMPKLTLPLLSSG